ncbi:hypothetical protein HKX48_007797 [Thoreauomyces humboldtii]|nr:hypothetical protein HKX48_007797 [Thoreauomyces humboldtii]
MDEAALLMSPVQGELADIPEVVVLDSPNEPQQAQSRPPPTMPSSSSSAAAEKTATLDPAPPRRTNTRHSMHFPLSTVASAAEADGYRTESLNGEARARKTRSFSQASIGSDASRLSYRTIPGSQMGDDGYAPGVVYQYYKGKFALLPDFNTVACHGSGLAPKIHIDSTTEATAFDPKLQKGLTTDVGNFAVRFTAQIRLPHAGQWTFYLSSNDGSALFVSGKKIIDFDGSHYAAEKEGTVNIERPGYYPISVAFFHCNGKMLEGLRTGASLTLSYYFPGTGWIPYTKDRVAKTIIPESAFVHNARDEQIAHILASSSSEEWSVSGNGLDDQFTREQEFTGMSERLMEVQKALLQERSHSQDLIRQLAKFSLFESTSLNSDDFLKTEHVEAFSDEDVVKMHEDQTKFVEHHLQDIQRLKLGYFFSLGVQLKLLTKQNNFSVQDAYERCASEKVPVQKWPSFLRAVMAEHSETKEDEALDIEDASQTAH